MFDFLRRKQETVDPKSIQWCDLYHRLMGEIRTIRAGGDITTRIDLDGRDTATWIAEIRRLCRGGVLNEWNIRDYYFSGMPMALNQPETKIRSESRKAYEQLRVLSATCFNPMKREAA